MKKGIYKIISICLLLFASIEIIIIQKGKIIEILTNLALLIPYFAIGYLLGIAVLFVFSFNYNFFEKIGYLAVHLAILLCFCLSTFYIIAIALKGGFYELSSFGKIQVFAHPSVLIVGIALGIKGGLKHKEEGQRIN